MIISHIAKWQCSRPAVFVGASRLTLALLAICVVGSVGLPTARAAEPIAIQSRRELMIDRHLIEKLDGLQLRMHAPHREGVALKFDKPWEGRYSGYITVLKDGDRYRMYYRGMPKLGQDGSAWETTCYAESSDGISWTRPDLGLHEVNGTTQNNVILAGQHPYSHNFAPFLDTRPGVAPSERYKALSGLHPEGLALHVSPDGLRWTLKRKAVITSKGFAFDSQACAFWSEAEQRYVCYFRTWNAKDSVRWISRTTSSDCLTWEPAVPMNFGDAPPEHLYTNATQPYFRAPHLYVALPQRFFPNHTALSATENSQLVRDEAIRGNTSDVALITTRGGDRYDRTFLESFIRPGPNLSDWAARNNAAAWGIVPGDERTMYLYRQGDSGQATVHAIRYSLRTDGFASVWAPFAGGEMLTRPLTFEGAQLQVNFEASAAGSLQVEIQDEAGQALPGFTLADCPPQLGDRIDHVVQWKQTPDVSSLAGKVVRLRFVLKDCDLYSFKFGQP